MKRILLAMLVIFILTACLTNEGKQFIENPETQRDVKELVEETLKKEEVPVKTSAEDTIYEPEGKGGQNEKRIRVKYETIHQPTFHKWAFVEVNTDSKPRTLGEVSESGIIHNYEYDLYDVVMAQAFHYAYKTSLTKMKTMDKTIPHLIYKKAAGDVVERDEPYVELALDRDQLTEEKKQALFNDYTANKFASPNEKEANALVDTYLFLEDDPENSDYSSTLQGILPNIYLLYTYEGTFNNDLMNELLDELQTIDGAPDAFYTITVNATDIEDDNAKHAYNKGRDGNYYNEFIGYIRIDGKTNEKSNSRHFYRQEDTTSFYFINSFI